jgi:hypothetical protein
MTLHESISIIYEIKEKNSSYSWIKDTKLQTKLHDLSNKNDSL